MAYVRAPRTPQQGWTVRLRTREDGRVRQVERSFVTEKHARSFVARCDQLGDEAALRELDEAAVPSGNALSLAQYYEGWLGTRHHLAPTSIASYTRCLDHLKRSGLGDKPLDSISRKDLESWFQEMFSAGYATNTVASRRTALSSCLNNAVNDGLIAQNPCSRITIRKTPSRPSYYLTDMQVKKIIAELPDETYRFIVILILATGMRHGEMRGLQWRSVTLSDDPAILIERQKDRQETLREVKGSRARRIIPLDPEGVVYHELSRRYIEGQTQPTDFVCLDHRGNPIKDHWRESVWLPACRRALPDLDPPPRIHDLRHTAATWWLHDGSALVVVRDLIGHASIRTTADTYGHHDREAMRAAARGMTGRLRNL